MIRGEKVVLRAREDSDGWTLHRWCNDPEVMRFMGMRFPTPGPRPMPPDVNEQISGWGRTRLDLTPGITGLWQVLGRTSIPFEEMVKLDYLYVTNWTLWQDVRLMIHTLPAVVKRRGVN